MEKTLTIKTTDRHSIYGTLTTPQKRTDVLLIFVHGFTGHQNEHLFYNGARFFAKHDIATFRFDLYTGEKGGRTLTDCGISTHANDLNKVIKFFRKKFQKIFVIGHSLGGLVILLSETNTVDGVVLWDSSCTLKGKERKDFKYSKLLDLYLVRWGAEFLMGKKMYDEWKEVPVPRVAIAKINKPIKVIVAGKGALIKAGQEYFKYAKEPKEFAIVNEAGHNFNEGNTATKLFIETLSFIKKYL